VKISVVTACYNQENTVQSTILSILDQEYGNLQYIFVDGASTDKTLEIAESHSDKIDVLISEPDDGQYHAIQKGFAAADGEIMAWLNGDDIYHSWTLSVVEEIFRENPDVDWIIHLAGFLQQESMFWRKSLWDKSGGLDLSLDLAADFKLWTQFAKFSDLVAVSVPLAAFRVSPGEQRSSLARGDYEKEVGKVCSSLDSPSYLWDKIARKGVVWRSACRLVFWKKAKTIAFSESRNRWILNFSYRPVSRASWAGLLLERFLR